MPKSGLHLRILLPFLALLLLAFAVVGWAAVGAVRARVEREAVERLEGARSVLAWINLRGFRPNAGVLDQMRQHLAGIEIAALDRDGRPAKEATGRTLSTLGPVAAAALEEISARRNFFHGFQGAQDFWLDLAGERWRASLAGDFPPAEPGAVRGFLLLYPQAEIRLAQARAIRPLLWLLWATLAGVGILSLAIARFVTQPLRRLAAEARAIADGGREVPSAGDAAGEVGDLARALATMVESLRRNEEALVRSEKLSAIGQIAAGIAHEIRNPLGAVRMTAELLFRDERDAERREALEVILSEIRRLENVLQDLLAYARPAGPEKVPCALNPLVEGVLGTLDPQLRHRGIEARTDLAPDLPEVEADPAQIRQALWNLLLNAVEATERGGWVKVATRAERDRALLRVSDTGGGIPPEVQGRIFEPFFTTKAAGTGLGLPLCRRVAEAHGGAITFVSEPGTGTTFELSLPRAVRPVPPGGPGANGEPIDS